MNSIIKEIHNSFSSAEDSLVAEAEQIIRESKDEEKKERTDKLAQMGFTNSQPVKRLSDEAIEKADTLIHFRKRYSRIAPQYKFITKDKVKEICRKYKIVVGPSQAYTADIPEKNQKDIANFKIMDDSFLEVNDPEYEKAKWVTSNGKHMHPKEMGTSHIINSLKMMIRKSQEAFGNKNMKPREFKAMITELTLRGEDSAVREIQHYVSALQIGGNLIKKLMTPYQTTYFYVAGDINSFDSEGMHIQDDVFLTNDHKTQELTDEIRSQLYQAYDPIVLAKVQGGYLVVTAWGDEASDPDVHNENLN